MKSLAIGMLVSGLLSTSLSYADSDCREVFRSYGNKHVYQSLLGSESDSVGVIAISSVASGFAVGGILETTGALGTYATLGSTIPIASFFVPGLLYFGVEGGIALSNLPHTKAAKLITQAYRYKAVKNDKRTRLLKRLAKRLDLSIDDFAETIIRSNIDGTLCDKNETKKDILESIRNKEIPVIDVDEDTYSHSIPKWTCGAKLSWGSSGYYEANGSSRSKAKRKAKALCAEGQSVEKCKWVGYCINNHKKTTSQYF